jgi:hypothetical protein
MVGKSEGDASLQPFGDQLEERLGLPRYLCLTFYGFGLRWGHGLALRFILAVGESAPDLPSKSGAIQIDGEYSLRVGPSRL